MTRHFDKIRLLTRRALCLLVGTSLWVAFSAHGESLATTLDWMPLEELTPAQRIAIPAGSCGAYIAPIRDDVEVTLKPDEASISIDANKISASEIPEDAGRKRLLIVGDVLITQGYRQLKADRAELDQDSGMMVMEGHIEIREPNLLILGERAVFNQKDSQSQIDQAAYVSHLNHIRGEARQLKREGENNLELLDASITRCEPGNNSWNLRGSRIKLDHQKRQGQIYHMRLEVKDIPVLYLPYLRFPLGDQRLSGFLAPNLRFEDSYSSLSLPYYFNLAPNYDWLSTPHFLEQHGVLYENHFRHLSRHFSTELNTAYLSDDRGQLSNNDQQRVNAGEVTESDAAPFKGEDRWLVQVSQQGGEGSAWSTDIDYTKVSDIDYFRDFDVNPAAGREDAFLDQKLNAHYRLGAWKLGAAFTRYQTLSESIIEPYEQIPALSANGYYRWDDWQLRLNHEWIDFDLADNGVTNSRLTGERLRANYRMTWDHESQWGFFKPTFQLKHLQYQLDDRYLTEEASESPSITAPQFILDTGLYFERYSDHYLQTFEPRLFYFYSDFNDHGPLFNLTRDDHQAIDFDTSELTFSYQQLFRDTRFSGGDRIDDADQLSIGFTTRFFGNESGREWFSASLGQIFYFDDRQVTLINVSEESERSDIALQFSSNPVAGLQFTGNALIDHSRDEMRQWNIKMRSQSSSKHLLELDYHHTTVKSEDIRELRGAVISQLFDSRWHLLLYSARDIERNRELDSIAAIEYNSCCVRFRVGYRRELDNRLATIVPDESFDSDVSSFVEVHFKGLGSTSGALDNLFEDRIDGFSEWQAVYAEP
jgi:LPS-assembly protein